MEGSPSTDWIFFLIGAVRFALGAGILAYSWMNRRWVVGLAGVIILVLSGPIIALAFGWDIPPQTVLAISGLHALLDVCIFVAVVSSTSAVRRLRLKLAENGIDPQEPPWRP